ncbi:hypothetical protein A2U01_0104198, partial [Trifolium medium]|nr:hypothetical protein [Trifolium medium]
MFGTRRGPGRPKRYVEEEEEPEMDPGGDIATAAGNASPVSSTTGAGRKA